MSAPEHLQPGPERKRRVWPIALVIILLALLAAGGAAVWLLPFGEERDPDAVEEEGLETHEFEGALLVMSLGDGSVDTTGESCTGTDGYEDIHADAPVVVSDPDGSELARTRLGHGEALDEDSCIFGFTVELTEGSGHYEVSLGEHHLETLTWGELHNRYALSFVVGGVG